MIVGCLLDQKVDYEKFKARIKSLLYKVFSIKVTYVKIHKEELMKKHSGYIDLDDEKSEFRKTA